MKVISIVLILIFVSYGETSHHLQRTRSVCKAARILHHPMFSLFKNFIVKYQKHYDSPWECGMRFYMFVKSLKQALKYQKLDKGTATYGPTARSDLSETESTECLFQDFNLQDTNTASIPYIRLPKEFDWRKHGSNEVINPVQNQGICGSCYAFGVVGNVEGVYAVKHKILYKLSEQQIVDCDQSSQGCRGGTLREPLRYIAENGAMLAQRYPYKGTDEMCKYSEDHVKLRTTGIVDLPDNDTAIARYMVQYGPVTAAVNGLPLKYYRGGIINIPNCSRLCNHAVLLVGFGVGNSRIGRKLPYWIVKNSWGTNWGEDGYFRIAMGSSMCGITSRVHSATV